MDPKSQLTPPTTGKKHASVPPVSRDVQKLASASLLASGSATGNPRNKCALQPGHSLMDWIRLGQSGRDLTGVGSRAGSVAVSPRQLAEHCRPEDAWIAIRGKVYNITAYLAFHPGGEEELMRGAGRDATALFNEVHAWVNYESILQKCLIGRLSAFESDVDAETLFNGTEAPKSKPSPKYDLATSKPPSTVSTLKFDWIQKMDFITIIFYTKAFSNPQLQVLATTNQKSSSIQVTYDGTMYTNELQLSDSIHERPWRLATNHETGKLEVHFRKVVARIWSTFGQLTQSVARVPALEGDEQLQCTLVHKHDVNYNTFVLVVRRNYCGGATVPIGKHIRVCGEWNGQRISRSYTPVPWSMVAPNGTDRTLYSGDICLLVKRYTRGMLSPFVCDRSPGETISISRPLGSFALQSIEDKDSFLFLAAGTGLTPILGLLAFVLARTIHRCLRVTLFCFNRKEKDILCRQRLEQIQNDDSRLRVEHILSEPPESWLGHRGHVTESLLKTVIDECCEDNHLLPSDLFVSVCGPTPFTNRSQTILRQMGYQKEHMHCFLG